MIRYEHVMTQPGSFHDHTTAIVWSYHHLIHDDHFMITRFVHIAIILWSLKTIMSQSYHDNATIYPRKSNSSDISCYFPM